MQRFVAAMHRLIDLSLLVAGAGIAVVVIGSWVTYLGQTGLSFGEAWASREPWTSIGTWITLVGTTAVLGVGGLATLVQGGWLRRVLLVPALILPALWWAMALRVIAGPGVSGAPTRPPFPGWEPAVLAYQFPLQTAVMLLAPAAVVAFLALAPSRPTTAYRIAPVHEGPDR